jgi:hypothetical protein
LDMGTGFFIVRRLHHLGGRDSVGCLINTSVGLNLEYHCASLVFGNVDLCSGIIGSFYHCAIACKEKDQPTPAV